MFIMFFEVILTFLVPVLVKLMLFLSIHVTEDLLKFVNTDAHKLRNTAVHGKFLS